MKKRFLIIFLLLFAGRIWAENYQISIVVSQENSDEIVQDASVVILAGEKVVFGTITSQSGKASFKIPKGDYHLAVTHVGFAPLKMPISLNADTLFKLRLKPVSTQLEEVVITASETKKIGSVSLISRQAMQHLQPNSLSDLMELLPGGISKTPNLTSSNSAELRETGTLGALGQAVKNDNFATNALGTLFVVDGAPINTDGNLQKIVGFSSETDNARNATNRGVDMRSLGTDDIEAVEIVRGIPSVEYGNLTSGVVNIKKIRRPTKLSARIKADDKSQLFSLGKGFSLGDDNSVLNLDGSFLNAFADIRNPLENYKRGTLSLRFSGNYKTENFRFSVTPTLEYSGELDGNRVDEDLNPSGADSYNSQFHRLNFGSGFLFSNEKNGVFKNLNFNFSLSQQFDRLERTRLVSPPRIGIAPASTAPGVWDAHLLMGSYVATHIVDGKPFSAFARLAADFEFNPWNVKNAVKIGSEWNLNKNFGDGQIYDLSRPLSFQGWGARPRSYREIPALQNLAFYLEDFITAKFSKNVIEARLGIRSTTIPGLSKQYAISGKMFFDPRLNLQWTLPELSKNGVLLSFSGGWGLTTRMPTLDYLFPEPTFKDILQLAYYDIKNPLENSRYNVRSYRLDATNYDLQPARNQKWEIRSDLEFFGNRFWVCFFSEKMNSGFRYSSFYQPLNYQKFTVSSVEIGKKPDLTTLPFEEKTILGGYNFVENGSEQNKIGVEFEFTSKRVQAIYTKFRFSGAWFRSVYKNSQPVFYPLSSVVNGESISDHFIGLYSWNDGRENEQLSTNLLLDTQVKNWGLIFSTSLQTVWYVSTRMFYKNSTPEKYLATDGILHDFTEENLAQNPLLQHLTYQTSATNYEKFTIPPAFYLNLKITKNIKNFLTLSVFVNRLLDFTPDFYRAGVLIRRTSAPYFGMELGLKL